MAQKINNVPELDKDYLSPNYTEDDTPANIELVCISTDDNYRDWADPIIDLWNHLGYKVLLVSIEDSTYLEDKGTHYHCALKADKNYSTKFQAQLARIWAPKLFPDKMCFVSDIDMIPVSKEILESHIEKVGCKRNQFTAFGYGTDMSRIVHFFPFSGRCCMSFNLATGKMFEEMFHTKDESFERFIKRMDSFIPVMQAMGKYTFDNYKTENFMVKGLNWLVNHKNDANHHVDEWFMSMYLMYNNHRPDYINKNRIVFSNWPPMMLLDRTMTVYTKLESISDKSKEECFEKIDECNIAIIPNPPRPYADHKEFINKIIKRIKTG